MARVGAQATQTGETPRAHSQWFAGVGRPWMNLKSTADVCAPQIRMRMRVWMETGVCP